MQSDPAPPFNHPHKRLERMVFFSDAVFAIAMTLLALELKISAFEGAFSWANLDGLLPKLLGCATSYAIVGVSWWAHTRICRKLIAIDDRLIAFNLLRLFFITIVPLPTSVLMEHGGSADSWIFYAFVMALSGTSEVLMWMYASSRPELVGPMSRADRHNMMFRLLGSPAGFVVSGLAARFGDFNSGWIVLSVLLGPGQALSARFLNKRLASRA